MSKILSKVDESFSNIGPPLSEFNIMRFHPNMEVILLHIREGFVALHMRFYTAHMEIHDLVTKLLFLYVDFL
jgi:hypothetical protein